MSEMFFEEHISSTLTLSIGSLKRGMGFPMSIVIRPRCEQNGGPPSTPARKPPSLCCLQAISLQFGCNMYSSSLVLEEVDGRGLKDAVTPVRDSAGLSSSSTWTGSNGMPSMNSACAFLGLLFFYWPMILGVCKQSIMPGVKGRSIGRDFVAKEMVAESCVHRR